VEFWEHNATPLPVDEPLLRLLDMLLKEEASELSAAVGVEAIHRVCLARSDHLTKEYP
jgi:hypothetical protein